MKEKLLEIAKEELKKTIDNISYTNLTGMQGRINHIFNMLSNAKGLDDLEESEKKPVTSNPIKIKTNPVNIKSEEALAVETSTPETDEAKESDDDAIYEFERKLKGGILKDLNAFVPEKTIRQLGLESGDKVKAKLLSSNNYNAMDRYDFELVEKHEGEPIESEIIEINMGIVHHDFQRDAYIVKEYVGEEGRMDVVIDDEEHPNEVVLQDRDIESMNILDKDIVDIAYYKNNPKLARVRWIHLADQLERPVPKKSSYYKDSDSDDEDIDPVLDGYNIVVVGGDSQWTAYREEVESLGGNLITKGGNDSIESIETAVRKSDCLINNIRMTRHRASGASVEIAKEYNVPFATVENMGRSTFINKVKELLEV